MIHIILIFIIGSVSIWALHKFGKYPFVLSLTGIIIFGVITFMADKVPMDSHIYFTAIPLFAVNVICFTFIDRPSDLAPRDKYHITIPTEGKPVKIKNIRRGISIIGSAGSGKTESCVYYLMKHLGDNNFCGVMHDYKNLELTEIAFPLFENSDCNFYVVCFERFFHRVNPIAPEYMTQEEDVNEISRVLTENLLELKNSNPTGSGKFFNDVVEGLIGGLIWRLKSDFPEICTLPHLIAIYQLLDVDDMVEFLSDNITAKSIADSYIKGVASPKQTAGVNSTLSNAFKRLSTKRIFYVLSGNEIPLNVNGKNNKSLVSVVNNVKYDSSYSPVIASIIHTITKQMSTRDQESSFLLMEEASTIRLLNMERLPATMRSYDISTIYVLQDKVQNDILYGDLGSKAILSNLSYQFFGKVNDPNTAKYYESFFEIVKRSTKSVSSSGGLNMDTRTTTGEKEQAKIRAEVFFRLRAGEFVTFADGVAKTVQFKRARIEKKLPPTEKHISQKELDDNFLRIHQEVRELFTVSS